MTNIYTVRLTGQEVDALLTGLGCYRDVSVNSVTEARIENVRTTLTVAVQEVLGGPDCWCGTVGRPEGAEPHLRGTGEFCGRATRRAAADELTRMGQEEGL